MPADVHQYSTAPRAWARICGLLWAITIATGVFAEFFVRGRLHVAHDPATTVRNILANEPLYRLAYAADFIGTAAYLALTAILYRLLAPVSRTVSLIAAFFSVAGCTIGMLLLVNGAAPLLLSGNPLPALGVDQMQSLAFSHLVLRREALNIGLMCFGVQCFLVGGLILRSTFLPKLLGVFLAIGGAGYLFSGFAHILALPLESQIGIYGYLPGMAAEAAIALWLMLVGLNSAKWNTQIISPTPAD